MREFYIQDDGIRLHAKLDMPEGVSEESGKCPLCIVIHGLTGHMEETHIIGAAKALNEEGIATLRVEMYGHGKSEGDFAKHTLYKWLGNAMTVTDYAKTLPFVTDLYVMGHSQGGLTTMLLAGLKPDDFKAIIPLSPAIVIVKGAKKGAFLGLSFDPEHVPDRMSLGGPNWLDGNYMRVAQTIDLDLAISKYHGPVLFVHGTADEACPIEDSMEAAAKYDNARLVKIDGDDHCYTRHLDKVLDALHAFARDGMR
ncbi:MAG: alpha/beta fold hydrolase [Firmicutes bacterium]|nr:alpha/beta fold hydrolase [Bacillota bacterium]